MSLSAELREHLNRSSDQIFLVDPQYCLLYLNAAALDDCRKYGVEPVPGQSLWRFFPEAEGSIFHRAYQRALSTGDSSTFEDYYAPLDIWFQQSLYPDADGLWIYSRDVTARRASEHRAREQEALYQARFEFVLDGIDLGVWYCDLPFDKLQWDARTKRHFGLAPEDEVDIERFYQIIIPEDREKTRLAIAESMKDKNSYDTVYRTRGPDGKLRWIRALGRTTYDAEGQPIRFDGITLDVSEQYRIEQEMLRSEHRYRLLVEATSAIVWSSDSQGCFVQPQKTWQDYTGQDWTRHSGTGWQSAIHPDDLEGFRSGFQEACRQRQVYQAAGRLWHQRTESYRFVELKAVPLLGSDGMIREWVGTIFDVQERREAELAALRANRMKTEFLANMSHELRTPMTGVQGMVELLFDTSLQPLQREYVQTIKECSQSLLAVLDDVLDLSRIEAGKLLLVERPHDLRKAIASTLALFALQAEERGLQLRVNISPAVPEGIEGDPDRIRQILVNLLSNAMKFTPEGFVELRVDVAGEQLVFAVEDTGIGIAEADQAKLFRPFVQLDSTTSRRYHGTGLGLSIVARLIQIMGGEIRLESQPGKGSTFRFAIPLKVVPMSEITAAQAMGDEVRSGIVAHILLVEDNPINRRVVTAQLEKLGHSVTVVDGGGQALALFDSGARFDLVLMDCQMPELDGYETTRRLRSQGYQLPVVALTAHAMEGERDRCLAAGMSDYLTKPLSQQDLRRTLTRWLEPPHAEVALKPSSKLAVGTEDAAG